MPEAEHRGVPAWLGLGGCHGRAPWVSGRFAKRCSRVCSQGPTLLQAEECRQRPSSAAGRGRMFSPSSCRAHFPAQSRTSFEVYFLPFFFSFHFQSQRMQ